MLGQEGFGSPLLIGVPGTGQFGSAIFDDGQGFTFTFDVTAPDVATSQESLVSHNETSLVSFDGSAVDITFSAGLPPPGVNPRPEDLLNLQQVVLGNFQSFNSAATRNLLPVDLVEEFRPENWSLRVVPEPSGAWGAWISSIAVIAASRKRRQRLA